MHGKPMTDRDDRDEDDHRTMMRASEIQADRSRMKGVARCPRKQTKALGKMGRSMVGKRRGA